MIEACRDGRSLETVRERMLCAQDTRASLSSTFPKNEMDLCSQHVRIQNSPQWCSGDSPRVCHTRFLNNTAIAVARWCLDADFSESMRIRFEIFPKLSRKLNVGKIIEGVGVKNIFFYDMGT